MSFYVLFVMHLQQMAANLSMSPQEEGELSDRDQQCSSDESELKENRKRKFAENSDASDKEGRLD